MAVDILLPAGTPITAPDDGYVLFVEKFEERRDYAHMANVVFYSQKGILYKFVHVDVNSLPEETRDLDLFIVDLARAILAGSGIASIAEWPTPLQTYAERNGVIIPPKIATYYTSQNIVLTLSHLHLATYNMRHVDKGDGQGFRRIYDVVGEEVNDYSFNPLLLTPELSPN